MKKFRFALQPLLKTKRVFKKQKQAEYAQACAALENLLSERSRLEEELDACGAEYGRAVTQKVTPARMAWYDRYLQFVRQKLAEMEPAVRAAEEKKEALRGELVTLVRETETLEKLEREQYRDYLREAAKDEEKVLGDLMAYNSVSADD